MERQQRSRTGGWKSRPRVCLAALLGLFSFLLAQGLAASEAQATNWVVNINDTGYDPIPLGGIITYGVKVENDDVAAAAAPETTLTLDIPGTFTFIGASGTITDCKPVPAAGPGTVTCTVPALAGGTTATLSARVRTSLQGTFAVTASVPQEGDSQPANNSAAQPTTVTDGTDLELSIAGPDSAASGSMASYDFAVENKGPLPATDIEVTIPAPAGLTDIMVPPGCSFVSPNYVCTIPGPIAVGGSASLTLSGQIAVAPPSSITVTGSITGSSPPDPVPGVQPSVTTTVNAGSDLKIAKARSPSGVLLTGAPVAFTLTPSYTGAEPNGLKIVDDIPANYQVDEIKAPDGWTCGATGQRVECTLGRLCGPQGREDRGCSQPRVGRCPVLHDGNREPRQGGLPQCHAGG